MTPAEFITKWRASELKESSAAEEHFIDLRQLLGEPTPASPFTGRLGSESVDAWPGTGGRLRRNTRYPAVSGSTDPQEARQ